MNLPDFDVVLENKPLASKIMSHKRSIQNMRMTIKMRLILVI